MPHRYRTVTVLACLCSRTGALPYWLCGIYRYSPIALMRTVPVRNNTVLVSECRHVRYLRHSRTAASGAAGAGRGAVSAGTDYLNTNSMPAALPVLVGLSVHMPLRYTQRVRVGARRGRHGGARITTVGVRYRGTSTVRASILSWCDSIFVGWAMAHSRTIQGLDRFRRFVANNCVKKLTRDAVYNIS